MPSLISPGVSVTIIDESFYVPGRVTTIPMIFVATADEKLQADGLTPALGTFEYGIVRTVTSINQSVELYGVPRFLASADGQPFHGDARNEYGLDALNKFLEIGNRAYVVRANVNLADDLPSIKALWGRKVGDAADFLNVLVADFIDNFNLVNNLVPADVGFKQTVEGSELKTLIDEALVPVLDGYSFSSTEFELGLIQDHTIDHPGYQEVCYDTSGGFLQLTDVTGLNNDTTIYGAEINVVDNGGSNVVLVSVQGQDVQTFGQLILELQNQIQAVTGDLTTTVELLQGKIRITSGLAGVTSSIEVVNDGPSGTVALFANTNLFEQFGTPVSGLGPNPLTVYDDTFTTIIGSYDGLDSLVDNWLGGTLIADEFTPDEAEGLLLAAATDFDNTKEFRNATSLGANDAARRSEIVQRLQGVINNPNTNVRGDNLEYNVALTPGYWETADELLRLSQDLREEVFVIGETPFDRPATGPNSIVNWATSPDRATSANIAYYYPHGLSSNIDGVDILTTASATALRAFAINDRDTEVWFAPAGPNRGTAEHLTTVGYISGTLGGPTLFVEDFTDQGTRDTLYEFPKNINPVSFISGRGILVMGQKTTSPTSSALDRVNVSRLVKFIKRELRKALFSYLFEPNDTITRENVKATTDSFLGDLIDRRALYDFATICDLTNNTPARIDRNELWIDIAIKPIKAVEFIFVPIRIVNTGAEIGGRDIQVGV